VDKQITFYFFSSFDYRIKRMAVSGTFFSGFCVLILLILACLGYLCHDYYRLRHHSLNAQELTHRLAGQHRTMTRQQRQIDNFIVDINKLKHKLIALKAFEEKLRIVADVDPPLHRDSRFGIGGSMPEDLDPGFIPPGDHRMLNDKIQKQIASFHASSEDQRHRFETLFNGIEQKLTLLASTPSIRPTRGYISSGFGYRASPFTGKKEFHRGLDLATRTGTPVVAPADGIVAFTGRKGVLGQSVVIDHGHGMVTRYGHLHTILARTGDRVKRGDDIARVGSSGRSTGPHLHYEVSIDGMPVNPVRYILN
jgi:Peptidase family M23